MPLLKIKLPPVGRTPHFGNIASKLFWFSFTPSSTFRLSGIIALHVVNSVKSEFEGDRPCVDVITTSMLRLWLFFSCLTCTLRPGVVMKQSSLLQKGFSSYNALFKRVYLVYSLFSPQLHLLFVPHVSGEKQSNSPVFKLWNLPERTLLLFSKSPIYNFRKQFTTD